MVSWNILDSRRSRFIVIAIIGFCTLFLLILSYIVEVRIILESPNYGDVTDIAKALSRIVLGAIAAGASISTIYDVLLNDEESEGPDTEIVVKGGDVDLHLNTTLPEFDENEE